jgi:hypothetical protein
MIEAKINGLQQTISSALMLIAKDRYLPFL